MNVHWRASVTYGEGENKANASIKNTNRCENERGRRTEERELLRALRELKRWRRTSCQPCTGDGAFTTSLRWEGTCWARRTSRASTHNLSHTSASCVTHGGGGDDRSFECEKVPTSFALVTGYSGDRSEVRGTIVEGRRRRGDSSSGNGRPTASSRLLAWGRMETMTRSRRMAIGASRISHVLAIHVKRYGEISAARS